MRIFQSLIALCFVLSLVSCGDAGINGRKRITITKESLTSLMKHQEFECAPLNGGSCPTGMARIFIHNPSEPSNSATCSGFLNGSRKIVTNNHCVSTQTECANTYITIYKGSHYESVRCNRIIKTKVDPGALNQKGVDYTVLELSRAVEVSSFALADREAFLNEELTAWVIDHQTLNRSRITELNCRYHRKGNSMQLANCPVIQGNSGSPLLNSRQEVVGLIWGSTTDEEVNADYSLLERRALNDYAFATLLKHFSAFLSV